MRLVPAGFAALVAGFAFGLAVTSQERHEAGSATAESRADPQRMSVFGTIHPKRFDVAWASLGLALSDGARVRVASAGTDGGLGYAAEEADGGSAPRRRLSFDERFLQGEGFDFDHRSAFEERFVFDRSSVFEERFAFDQRQDQRQQSFEQRFVLASASSSDASAPEAEERTSSVPSVVRLPAPSPRNSIAGRSGPSSGPTLASVSSTPAPASAAKKVRLASLEMPKATSAGTSLSVDPESKTAIYDISARTVYMPDGRRLEAHSGLGDRMDDPRHVNVRREGATPPGVYNLTMRESLFHGVRAIRLTPVGDTKMYGRDGILAHTYMLGPNGQSNGCVSFADYPAFLQAFQRGEVTRIAVVEHLANPPAASTQFAGWLPKSLREFFGGPDRSAAQPERATGYASAN